MIEIEAKIIEKRNYLEDQYITADEMGNESWKKAIGKDLKKLRKCLKILRKP